MELCDAIDFWPAHNYILADACLDGFGTDGDAV
jgi:hypothetical protein